jgi:hypothetical protein
LFSGADCRLCSCKASVTAMPDCLLAAIKDDRAAS